MLELIAHSEDMLEDSAIVPFAFLEIMRPPLGKRWGGGEEIRLKYKVFLHRDSKPGPLIC